MEATGTSLMRTARRVIVSILLAACFALQAQDTGLNTPSASIDQSLTIVGRDDTVIPVPQPPPLPAPALPGVDTTWLAPPDPPPVAPPPALLEHPPAVPGPQDVLSDLPSR